jgi:hypothetical protein
MKTKSIILLVSAIISFVVFGILMNKMDYSQYKNEKDCIAGVMASCANKNCCACWDGTQCRKGTLYGLQCVCKGSIWPMFFLILGTCLLVLSIFFFFKKTVPN